MTTFIVIVGIIVITIVFSLLHQKVESLRRFNDLLQKQLWNLNNRIYTLELDIHRLFISQNPDDPNPMFDPAQNPNPPPNLNPMLDPAQNPNPAPNLNPMFDPAPNLNPMFDPAPNLNPMFDPAQNPNPMFDPAQNPNQRPPAKAAGMENWLGQKVFGIVAAILIFIGLIFLGTLVYEKIGDAGRALLMYAVSLGFVSAGLVLERRNRNSFTLALIGCGFGSFFISTMMAHIYFGLFPDYTAFAILLIWTGVTLYMSKKLDTNLLSIIAHIGTIISVCFAFYAGTSGARLALLLCYQWASIALITIGSAFFCRKTYQFGLFSSFALTLVASGFMSARFISHRGVFNLELPDFLINSSFFAQFLCTSILSYFLAMSANRLCFTKDGGVQSNDLAIISHLIGKLLWIGSLWINVLNIVSTNSADNSNRTVLIGCTIIAIHIGITIIMRNRAGIIEQLETISITSLSIFCAILLIYRYFSDWKVGHLSFLFALAIVMFLIYRLRKNKTYLTLSNVFLCIDALLILVNRYDSMFGIHVTMPFVTFLVILALFIGKCYLLPPEDKSSQIFYTSYIDRTKIICYIFTHLSLFVIFLGNSTIDEYIPYPVESMLCIMLILNIALYILKFGESSKALHIIMKITEYILLISSAIYLAENSNIIIALLSFGLAFIQVRRILEGESESYEQIIAGIKLTILTLASINGFANGLESYSFSFICMITAFVCITAGFKFKAKALRLYGLIITILSVVKLVIFDVSSLTTPLRVISLIGGGIICFVISAIYNYAVKSIDTPSE